MSDVDLRAPARERGFSWGWAAVSALTFIVLELLLGRVIGPLVLGQYQSIQTAFVIQGSLLLGSYLIGGFVIGVVSPGVRIMEPAIGAFLSIVLAQVLTLFTPYGFIRIDATKLLLGGAIAFVIALAGARAGERLMGNLRDESGS